MKLGHKITASYAVIVVLIVIAGAFNYYKLKVLTTASDVIEHEVLPSVQSISKIKYLVSSVRRLESQMVIASGDERKSLILRSRQLHTDSLSAISEMRKHVSNDGGEGTKKYVSLLDDLEKNTKIYFSINEKIINQVDISPDGVTPQVAVKMIFSDARTPYNAMLKAVDDIFESNAKFATAQGVVIDMAYDSVNYLLITGVIIIVLVSVFLAWKITTMVIVPVKKVASAAEKVAQGDLTTVLPKAGTDEIGELVEAVLHMQNSLKTLVTHVKSGSESVALVSNEIAQGNMDLSSRTESQASALEETAASMEELSSTVSHNSDTANEANQLAHTAALLATKGGTAVGQVVNTMKEINDSSKNIADIISVIDGIAFQTNILALNAAVEAARAGDQGKGFAVVASEVRSLAGRSADAAKQIKILIDTSVGQVSHGVKLADDAGNQMTQVVTAINKVTQLVKEISTASKDQASGVAQVGEAISQMDHVTQQNAALVEEMAAAASGLKIQSEKLVSEVKVFKVS